MSSLLTIYLKYLLDVVPIRPTAGIQPPAKAGIVSEFASAISAETITIGLVAAELVASRKGRRRCGIFRQPQDQLHFSQPLQ